MMKKCPTCGVLLSERLVDAITNPFMDESCPEQDQRDRVRTRFIEAPPVVLFGEMAGWE